MGVSFVPGGHMFRSLIAIPILERDQQDSAACEVAADGSPECGSEQDALDVGAWGVEGLKGGFGQGGDVNYELMENVAKGSAAYQLARGVGLLWVLDNEQKEWIPCTAFLISEEHLLTAGHCVMKVDGENEWRKIGQAKFVLGYLGEAAAKAKSPGFDVVGKGMVSLDLHLGRACDASENATESKKTEAAKPEHRDTDAHYRASDKDQGLDYALLGLCPGEFQRKVTQSEDEDVRRFGPVDIAEVALEEKHDLLLIHHPERFRQVLTQRYCRTVDQKDGDPSFPANFRHLCDTHGGSSGAPIFSRRHEAVTAIHTCCTYHHGDAAELAVSRFNRAVHIAAVAEVNDVVRRLMIKNPLTAEQRQRLAEAADRAAQSRRLLEEGDPKLAAFVAYTGLAPFDLRKDAEHLFARTPDLQTALINAISSLREQTTIVHDAHVVSVRFHPDGVRVLTVSTDAVARLWAADTGSLLAELRHDGSEAEVVPPSFGPQYQRRYINEAIFSPSGDRILTAGNDGTVRMWNLDGTPGGPVFRSDDLNFAGKIAMSPDGSRIAAGGWNGVVRLWNSVTGAPLGQAMRHYEAIDFPISHVEFSADGARLLSASHDGTARLWNGVTGAPVGAVMRHENQKAVDGAAFDPAGSRIITWTHGSSLQVWDGYTGDKIGDDIGSDNAWILHASFSPDGSQIITASDDRTARVWDLETRKQVGVTLEHGSIVTFAGFSPQGDVIATADNANVVRLWDVETGEVMDGPMKHDGMVLRVSFSRDSTRLATASADKTARIWNAANLAPIVSRVNHPRKVTDVDFNPAGDRIATASEDGRARIWTAAGTPTGVEVQHEGQLTVVAFSPTGESFLTGSTHGTVRLWDTDTGEPIGEIMRNRLGSRITSAQFNRAGNRIVTAAEDDAIRIWEGKSGRLVNEIERHDDVEFATFDSSGKRIVSTTKVGEARIWDITTGTQIGDVMRHESQQSPFGQGRFVLHAEFSPQGNRVVTASEDGAARVWDAETGKQVGQPLQHGDAVFHASFSPAGDRIVTASFDGTARLWNAEDGAPVGAVMHSSVADDGMHEAVFSPNGNRLVTASSTAQMWDAKTGLPTVMKVGDYTGYVEKSEFSSDGRLVATASDRALIIWTAPPSDRGLLAAFKRRTEALIINDPADCARYRLDCDTRAEGRIDRE